MALLPPIEFTFRSTRTAAVVYSNNRDTPLVTGSHCKSFSCGRDFFKPYWETRLLDVFVTTLLTLILARLVWVDVHSFRLPDTMTLPLIAAGVMLSAVTEMTEFWMSVTGGIAGYALFWLVGTVYFRRTGVDALGLGDAKLFAASGTWLGILSLPLVLLISSVSGLLFALIMQKNLQQRLAFGPWLALGFWIVWIMKSPH